MLATVQSGAIVGLEAVGVSVEVDYNPRGMTGFTIVGLPDAAVQESRERVRSAIRNRNLDFPMRRYLVNLAPADGIVYRTLALWNWSRATPRDSNPNNVFPLND